jgi:hypothetical protein
MAFVYFALYASERLEHRPTSLRFFALLPAPALPRPHAPFSLLAPRPRDGPYLLLQIGEAPPALFFTRNNIARARLRAIIIPPHSHAGPFSRTRYGHADAPRDCLPIISPPLTEFNAPTSDGPDSLHVTISASNGALKGEDSASSGPSRPHPLPVPTAPSRPPNAFTIGFIGESEIPLRLSAPTFRADFPRRLSAPLYDSEIPPANAFPPVNEKGSAHINKTIGRSSARQLLNPTNGRACVFLMKFYSSAHRRKCAHLLDSRSPAP